MKIAVVGGPVGARASYSVGSGRYDIARLSTALAGRGNDVRIYTADGAGEVRSAGPTLTRIPLSRGDVDSTDSLMPFIGEMARHLVDAWSRDQPDVVHCHGVSYGMAAQLAANRWPVPTVQALHGLGATARRRRLGRAPTDAALKLEKLLARNASALTADCTEDLDELMRMGCGRTKLSVLPPGVDIDDTAAADTSGLHTSESLRVVAVARDFSPAQGLSCVLRLLPSLRSAELTLVSTDDDDPTEILSLASEFGVADRVRVLAGAGDVQVASLFRSADVVVCPSAYEPSGRTVLEAMAAGAPVVACASGAAGDMVIADVTGLLVPPNNREALGRALRHVLSQSVLRQGMGLAGRSRARSRYSWDRVATEAEFIYSTALARHGSKHRLPPVGVG